MPQNGTVRKAILGLLALANICAAAAREFSVYLHKTFKLAKRISLYQTQYRSR